MELKNKPLKQYCMCYYVALSNIASAYKKLLFSGTL